MTTTPRILLTLALACSLGACKQDPGSVDSGVAPDKRGSDLTPAEQTELCESIDDYAASQASDDDARRYACTTTAVGLTLLSDTVTVQTCETLRDGCLQQDPMPPATPPECVLAVEDWSACMATVAELEACYTDIIDAQITAFKSLSCAKIDEYKTMQPGPAPESEACSRADAKCPGAGAGKQAQAEPTPGA